MIQICYTHSNTSDIWRMFNEQNRKFCAFPLFLISDKKPLYGNWDNIFIYKNSSPYWESWTRTLEYLKPKYFIYLQEDFVLYDKVDESKIKEFEDFLDENLEYSFVRLIKSGNLNNQLVGPNLFEVETSNENIFSMQTSIWRTEDFLSLYKEVKETNWMEPDTFHQGCRRLGMKGVYNYNNEPKRGMAHYDSSVYPYIATALVKGKWNLSEYKDELMPLLNQYEIDPNIRGTF